MRLTACSIALLLAGCGLSAEAPTFVESGGPAVRDGRVLTESIGLETLGGVFTPLLECGCELPCRTTQNFSTAEDNQAEVTLSLYRGTSERAAENHHLGKFTITRIAPMPRGEPTLRVELVADRLGIAVRVEDPSGKSRPKIARAST